MLFIAWELNSEKKSCFHDLWGERGEEYGYFETFLRQLVPPNGFTARWRNGARGINAGWLGWLGWLGWPGWAGWAGLGWLG